MTNLTAVQKREISLRYWLLGKGYLKAVEAMEFGAFHHTGTRKDGITPEFDHQISIAHYVRTLLPHLLHAEETLCTVFLHDVAEDYGVSPDEIEDRFGTVVANAVWAMTKVFRGEKKVEADVFRAISQNPVASIAKGADRDHNLHTMVGVFSKEKQIAYINETETFFFPMLKEARRRFPQQEMSYESIKHVLKRQMQILSVLNNI